MIPIIWHLRNRNVVEIVKRLVSLGLGGWRLNRLIDPGGPKPEAQGR